MKCFRAKLTERSTTKDQRESKTQNSSPRHYCQRRLADSSHDEREWLRRFTPERFHLSTRSSNESEGDSRSMTPLSVSEAPEIFEIKTPKNVFRPAFLTVTNLDLPPSIEPNETKASLKRRAQYKTVPKHCSAHMHRMFVKNSAENEEEDISRTSSRASTVYETYAFEEYLCEFNTIDDSSDISLFETLSETRFTKQEYNEEDSSNSNDSRFMNKNNDKTFDSRRNLNQQFQKRENNKRITLNDTKKEKISFDIQKSNTVTSGNYKKEKRKSITISRVPSPETVQVIRVDVITGYPVDSDSLLSEITDEALNSEETSQLNMPIVNSECRLDLIEHEQPEMKCQSWKTTFGDMNYYKSNESKEHFSLLNCKSLNLSSRN